MIRSIHTSVCKESDGGNIGHPPGPMPPTAVAVLVRVDNLLGAHVQGNFRIPVETGCEREHENQWRGCKVASSQKGFSDALRSWAASSFVPLRRKLDEAKDRVLVLVRRGPVQKRGHGGACTNDQTAGGDRPRVDGPIAGVQGPWDEAQVVRRVAQCSSSSFSSKSNPATHICMCTYQMPGTTSSPRRQPGLPSSISARSCLFVAICMCVRTEIGGSPHGS